ncbi:unnamed protein product [Vitrella brassicaformis CCMP3155]|uniref:Cyclic nucleotide-binding domain-containing protein n=1 Tax=Vitrella brassicaformis (strain CCMP3155) TaxID=1169540 RepID=A0A0G4EN33_VITBC|nr:unnamed protein product [Vitrella brassicaformis CCMP3155]|eukprot:CEL98438.1 unnamed protein product [Vitrella brassicaformis CCMP3155]
MEDSDGRRLRTCVEILKNQPPKERSVYHVSQLRRLLEQNSFFSTLPEKTQKAVCQNLLYECFVKGTYLCRQGEEADNFYIILRGTCGIYIKPEQLLPAYLRIQTPQPIQLPESEESSSSSASSSAQPSPTRPVTAPRTPEAPSPTSVRRVSTRKSLGSQQPSPALRGRTFMSEAAIESEEGEEDEWGDRPRWAAFRVGILSSGASFGERGLITEQKRAASIKALLGPVEACYLTKRAFNSILKKEMGKKYRKKLAFIRKYVPGYGRVAEKCVDAISYFFKQQFFKMGQFLENEMQPSHNELMVIVQGEVRIIKQEDECKRLQESLDAMGPPPFPPPVLATLSEGQWVGLSVLKDLRIFHHISSKRGGRQRVIEEREKDEGLFEYAAVAGSRAVEVMVIDRKDVERHLSMEFRSSMKEMARQRARLYESRYRRFYALREAFTRQELTRKCQDVQRLVGLLWNSTFLEDVDTLKTRVPPPLSISHFPPPKPSSGICDLVLPAGVAQYLNNSPLASIRRHNQLWHHLDVFMDSLRFARPHEVDEEGAPRPLPDIRFFPLVAPSMVLTPETLEALRGTIEELRSLAILDAATRPSTAPPPTAATERRELDRPSSAIPVPLPESASSSRAFITDGERPDVDPSSPPLLLCKSMSSRHLAADEPQQQQRSETQLVRPASTAYMSTTAQGESILDWWTESNRGLSSASSSAAGYHWIDNRTAVSRETGSIVTLGRRRARRSRPTTQGAPTQRRTCTCAQAPETPLFEGGSSILQGVSRPPSHPTLPSAKDRRRRESLMSAASGASEVPRRTPSERAVVFPLEGLSDAPIADVGQQLGALAEPSPILTGIPLAAPSGLRPAKQMSPDTSPVVTKNPTPAPLSSGPTPIRQAPPPPHPPPPPPPGPEHQAEAEPQMRQETPASPYQRPPPPPSPVLLPLFPDSRPVTPRQRSVGVDLRFVKLGQAVHQDRQDTTGASPVAKSAKRRLVQVALGDIEAHLGDDQADIIDQYMMGVTGAAYGFIQEQVRGALTAAMGRAKEKPSVPAGTMGGRHMYRREVKKKLEEQASQKEDRSAFFIQNTMAQLPPEPAQRKKLSRGRALHPLDFAHTLTSVPSRSQLVDSVPKPPDMENTRERPFHLAAAKSSAAMKMAWFRSDIPTAESKADGEGEEQPQYAAGGKVPLSKVLPAPTGRSKSNRGLLFKPEDANETMQRLEYQHSIGTLKTLPRPSVKVTALCSPY